jgi:uncharacterized protein (DUF433 family)
MQLTKYAYVTSDETILGGEPIIVGTRTPLRAVVELWRQGLQAENIEEHLPHLSLAQIFAALSYYSDNQAEINDYIIRNRISQDIIDPFTPENT